MRKIAIIDLGTNTFHLMITQVEEDKVQVVHKEKVAVKIGEGGINAQVIIEEAQQRAITALTHFKKVMVEQGAQEVYAIATSAIRNASNSKQITDKIKQQTGIQVKVISGSEEAELIYLGVRQAMELGQEASLIMDIGGGSVEFVIGNRDTVFYKESFEIGAQRLLDLFHHHDPMQAQEVVRLESYLTEKLKPLSEAVLKYKPKTLIGSSGSFDTLSDIYCQQINLARTLTDSEYPLSLAHYQGIHQELLAKTKEERLRIPGMIPLRVDMIVVASCLIQWVIKEYHIDQLRVSAYALKEGALSQII